MSLGKVVRWLAEIAEKRHSSNLGFNGSELIFENGKIAGARTGASDDRHGQPMPNYLPPADVRAQDYCSG